jgi:hypothetical protein
MISPDWIGRRLAMNPAVTRIKYLGKQALFSLPGPVGRVAVSAACAANLLRLSYLVYFKLGRPDRVLSGPFAGMRYIPVAAGSAWMPKLLGTYETELRPTLAKFAAEPCDLLLDIGSAEGYYAVGLARMMNIPRVYGFDTDPSAQDMLNKLASLNGVADRVFARGFCSTAEMNTLLRDAQHPLVISDCEGGEVDVMDPAGAPELKRARMIIEVHDYYGADTIGSTLRARFVDSHTIDTVTILTRSLDEFPATSHNGLSDTEKLASLDEGRPPLPGWIVLRPKI